MPTTNRANKKLTKALSDRFNTDPNNHALKFSQYSERKDMFGQNAFPIISYIEPDNHDKNTKGINFAKMQKRDFSVDVKNIPSIGYYKPNIDIIKKKSTRTIRFDRAVDNNKRYLLQKLWKSYDVGTDYKLVKLNDV
jgi:hypothetical protein